MRFRALLIATCVALAGCDHAPPSVLPPGPPAADDPLHNGTPDCYPAQAQNTTRCLPKMQH